MLTFHQGCQLPLMPLRRDDADADADADNDADDNADDGDCHIFPATPGQQSLTIKIKSQ